MTWPTEGYLRGFITYIMFVGFIEAIRDATSDDVQTVWDILWAVFFALIIALYWRLDQREARDTVTVKKKDLDMLYTCAESYDTRIPANGHDKWARDIRKKLGRS